MAGSSFLLKSVASCSLEVQSLPRHEPPRHVAPVRQTNVAPANMTPASPATAPVVTGKETFAWLSALRASPFLQICLGFALALPWLRLFPQVERTAKKSWTGPRDHDTVPLAPLARCRRVRRATEVRTLVGEYTESGTNHGRKVFKKVACSICLVNKFVLSTNACILLFYHCVLCALSSSGIGLGMRKEFST